MNNTFNQFDQFEVPVSKNKCVFDFVQGSKNITSTTNSFWYIRSKPYSDSRSLTPLVKPIIFGKPMADNIYSEYNITGNTATKFTSTYPLGPDNIDENLVPIIQEDALINLTDPGTSKIGFRAGYLEISFKTTKQNSILLYGSGLYGYDAAIAIGTA